MAKVQRYDNVINAETVQPGMIALAGSTARAVGGMADTVADVSYSVAKQEQEAQATTWLTQASVELQKRMLDHQDKLQQQYGEKSDGYSKAMQDAFAQEQRDLMDGAPNRNAGRSWQQVAGSMLTSNSSKWGEWEKTRKVENYTVGLDDSLQQLQTNAYRTRDAAAWPELEAQVNMAMEGSKTLLDPQTVAKTREAALQGVAKSWWDGIYEDSPQAALALAKSGQLDKAMGPDKVSAMVEKATTAIKRQEREAEQSMSLARIEARGQAQDIEAALRAGVDVEIPDELIGAFKPEERAQWETRLKDAQSYGRDAQMAAYASPDEVQAMIGERSAKMVSGDVEGFKTQARDVAQLQDILSKRAQAISNDPAGYAASSPAMQKAAQELQAAPTDDPQAQAAAHEKYTASLIAEQQRLGVTADQVKYIPAAQASNMAHQLASIQEPGQQTAALQQLEQKYGKYWPQVSAQVFGGRDAPVPVGVKMAAFFGAGTPEADRIARVGAVYPELKKTFSEKEQNDVAKQLTDSLADMRTTFLAQNGGEDAYNNLQEGAKMLAMSYMKQGDDAAAAATKAADAIGARYTVVSDGSGWLGMGSGTKADAYRIPNADGLNTNAVIKNLNNLRSGISLDAYEAPYIPGVTELGARQLEQASKDLRNNGKFVTNPDESGVYLLFSDGQPLREKGTGQPVVFKFADMNSGTFTQTPENIEKLRYVLEQQAKEGIVGTGGLGLFSPDTGRLESQYRKYKSREAKQ